MERLWSPWRLAYVTGASGASTSNACIFCNTDEPGRDELILVRGRVSYVVLNLYPYNNGHLMVVPNRHVATLEATDPEERDELMCFTRHAEIALTEAYTPQGLNIGINLGRPAGAGVVDHLHVHVVPRWNGDTNFMTVVGEVRVLPEDLGATKKRLQPIFERLVREDR
ncbi:MAG: HIT family hydrolase [Acidobacteria bacterium 13_1_40CM_4_65_8]|jgi:ATP adenylyltransferase|nr:MAG: HIT family hydrolase [Acidobacteria bacterium 13_1_40CM_4_65_8]